jgi:hypothetical protein
MALPQIETPTFKMRVDSLGKEFKFRPFLVREQKILVMATESDDNKDMLYAAQQIISNCSFGKVNGEKLPLFEVQKTFLSLRSQSIGNVIELNALCAKCEAENEVFLDIDEVEIIRADEHTNKVELASDIVIEMKYPTVDEVSDLVSANEDSDIYHIVANNIETLYFGEDVIDFQGNPPDERMDWIDNLNSDQFDKIKVFFETMPQLYHNLEFKCKQCKEDNVLVIDGYENFFV